MTENPSATGDTMVELIKVSKSYPPDVIALSNVSLSIDVGEMFFIIGKSGAGKTTLLKLISYMEPPNSGLIEVAGNDLRRLKGNKLAKLRQRIGVAYQDFKLLLDRTVSENIAISMEVSYKQPSQIQRRVRSLLDQLQLADKHNTITGELSRGEQQRITLARAVANSPALLLVDEPTGNLDAETTVRVMQLLHKSNKSGATVVIATHDESIYRNTDHRVMELRQGIIRGVRKAAVS
ncbi:cell division ATP-binding protein FtsE [Desulfopila inferna]|uniref:cell division ATP-binding protein FtsE n=1 Tax=Desulfopila inferna TaxID=468528 RepID=UPI001F0524D0|nr:cell division ATP-binding protein FtsE [Desulfopila inferna]